jgi:magnesium-transporting ATPase (P-type)
MSLEFARTAAVNTLVMGQIVYLFNCRRLTGSVLSKEGFLGNPIALKAVAVLVGLQLAMTHLPFKQALFGTEHLDAETWLRVVAAVSSCCWQWRWRRFSGVGARRLRPVEGR